MSSIAGLDGKVTFSINGSAPITYDFAGADKDRTIGDILSDISTKAKVTMSYSELANKFVITSNNTGAVSSLTGSDDLVNTSASNGFLNTIFGSNSLGASVGTTTYTAGVDGQVTITEPNGVSGTVINASNNLSYDGVTYNLKSTGTTTISTTVDVQKTYDKIKALVTKYNDSISKITAKLNEKKLSAYPPLTDTQRAGMTADQISQWEVKAKQGLLANDNNLQNMLSSLRSAFYTSVQGAGIALADVGLSTSSDIFNHSGEIQIDDTKLKAAIQSNPDGVKKLFAQQSTSVPFYSSSLTPDQEKTKISEEGIFQRLNDILKQNLSTSPDSFGNRGMLVQKAGVSSSYSGFTDMLTQQITDENKVIADLNTKLAAKQQAYYTQFSKLETAMQTMNSQQSQLSSMLSGK
jgi:flagellar hook-associated protein 2